SRISFEQEAPDAAEIARRIMANHVHPWLVLDENGRILGYTSTSPMRGRRAYRWSVETGIYLDPAAQGRGLGRKLYVAHLDLIERQGFVTVVVGIAFPNQPNVALHEKLALTLTATAPGARSNPE